MNTNSDDDFVESDEFTHEKIWMQYVTFENDKSAREFVYNLFILYELKSAREFVYNLLLILYKLSSLLTSLMCPQYIELINSLCIGKQGPNWLNRVI